MFKVEKVKAGARVGISGKDYLILTSEDEKLFGLLELETGKIVFDINFTAEGLTEQINRHRHHTAKEFISMKLEKLNRHTYGDSAVDRKNLMIEILKIIGEGHRDPAGLANHYFAYDKIVAERKRAERDTW